MASGGLIILGIALTLVGAAALALAMVMQRYALSYPEERVPFLGRRWPRLVVWFAGLMAYAVANGLYAAALNFGPLSLLACVFTLLLVFNMFFARWLLEEALTPPKVTGCLTILVGVGCVVIAAARDAPNEFSPKDIQALLERAAGVIYLSILIGAVFASVIGILWYDHQYPALEAPDQQVVLKRVNSTSSIVKTVDTITPSQAASEGFGGDEAKPSPSVVVLPHLSQLPGANTEEMADAENGAKAPMPPIPPEPVERASVEVKEISDEKPAKTPPAWLDNVMGVVYPGSLGLDEGIAHLTMKGTLAMIGECSGFCNEGVFWFFLGLWIASSVATAWWLKVVFARYETTAALPIEYGMVNLASVCSGLIFYSEADYMDTWQVILSLTGLVIILTGIQCSRLTVLPCECLQKAMGG